jgi:hypothetical protein
MKELVNTVINMVTTKKCVMQRNTIIAVRPR